MITQVDKNEDGSLRSISLTAESGDDSKVLESVYADFLQTQNDRKWPQLSSDGNK